MTGEAFGRCRFYCVQPSQSLAGPGWQRSLLFLLSPSSLAALAILAAVLVVANDFDGLGRPIHVLASAFQGSRYCAVAPMRCGPHPLLGICGLALGPSVLRRAWRVCAHPRRYAFVDHATGYPTEVPTSAPFAHLRATGPAPMRLVCLRRLARGQKYAFFPPSPRSDPNYPIRLKVTSRLGSARAHPFLLDEGGVPIQTQGSTVPLRL